jgi:hypothetical protein
MPPPSGRQCFGYVRRQKPRAKKPSSASTKTTIKMIQRMPNALPPSVCVLVQLTSAENGYGPAFLKK